MSYSVVRYELKAVPSDVIIEIKCKDKQEAQKIYDNYLGRNDFKSLQIVEINNNEIV